MGGTITEGRWLRRYKNGIVVYIVGRNGRAKRGGRRMGLVRKALGRGDKRIQRN